MPTPLQRIQVCTEPELYAIIKTLAKGRNLSASAMAAQLLELAVSTPALRQEYKETAEKYGEVPIAEDKRKKPRQQPHFKVNHPEEGDGIAIKRESDRLSYGELVTGKSKPEDYEDIEMTDDLKRALMKKLMEELL